MTAAVFPASVAAYVVLVVLAIAVVERVVAPRALPAALVAHGVVPRRAAGPLAVVVTLVEAGLLVMGPLGLPAAAFLFASYAGYAWYVTATGRGGPCGCGGADVPMDHWVTGRAVALAALATVGAVARDSVLPLTGPDDRLLVVLLAAATIGILLWHLPAAMARPQEALR